MKKLFIGVGFLLLILSACVSKQEIEKIEKAETPKQQKPKIVVIDMNQPRKRVSFFDDQFEVFEASAKEKCKSFPSMLGDETALFPQNTVLGESAVKEFAKKQSGNEGELFLQKLQQELDETQISVSLFCATEKYLYATVFLTHLNNLQVLKWTKGEKYLERFQPVSSIDDGVYHFYPEVYRGDSFIRTFGGDAGNVWWSFYKLNPNSLTSELIENCSGGPSADAKTEADFSKTEFECSKEYIPEPASL